MLGVFHAGELRILERLHLTLEVGSTQASHHHNLPKSPSQESSVCNPWPEAVVYSSGAWRQSRRPCGIGGPRDRSATDKSKRARTWIRALLRSTACGAARGPRVRREHTAPIKRAGWALAWQMHLNQSDKPVPPSPTPSPFPLRTPSLPCAPPSLLIRPSFPFRPVNILLHLWLFFPLQRQHLQHPI